MFDLHDHVDDDHNDDDGDDDDTWCRVTFAPGNKRLPAKHIAGIEAIGDGLFVPWRTT